MLVPLGASGSDPESDLASDGVDLGGGADFAAALGRLEGRALTVVRAGWRAGAHFCRGTAASLSVKVLPRHRVRLNPASCAGLISACRSAKQFHFRHERHRGRRRLTLPVEIRTISHGEISNEHSAGAVARRKRWRRGGVGIATGATFEMRSRFLPRPTISRARLVHSPMCGSPSAARRRRP
jgi:hypothetical protein